MSLPPMPAPNRKVFVAYLDTHFGLQLSQRLIAQDYEVAGIIRSSAHASAVSPKIKKVFKRGDSDQIRKALLESDFVVYQLVDNVEDTIAAMRVLSKNHYELEKRFILVSSVMTWFQTPPLNEAAPAAAGDDEEVEIEAVTEDQFNRRVPHVKYLAWREAEKLCCSANCERLKVFVLFSGLNYGAGEDMLHPMFKQAWSLAREGLPVFGNGKQIVPAIHVTDLCTFVHKIMKLEELPEQRYFFATDDGNCSWKDMMGALNNSLGNGKTFHVPSHEFGLYDNVERFVVNLRMDAQQIQQIMEETDWVSKSGFVENIELLCSQYREERRVSPLRVLILGPPASGKSTAARELSAAMKVPHFNIADIVAEYKYQEVELQEELQRMKEERYQRRLNEKVEEKRQALLEEQKAAAERAAQERAAAEPVPNDDLDDVEEAEEIDVQLTPEEDKEVREAAEDDEGSERVAQINEKLDEIKRVLAMKLKPIGVEVQEPPNPKDKKKPAPKGKKAQKEEPEEEPKKDIRLSDRALAFMLKWKLTRTECRNHGFILDGFPKTTRQARLLFEDVPIEIPEDPEEPDMPLDKEEKPCADNIFPDVLIHCKAGDTFLLERLQKIQFEHPHNNPEDFQRRLEDYKSNFEVSVGVLQYLESARTTQGKMMQVRAFDMEQCPLVFPPPPKSAYAPKQVDPVISRMQEFLGKPHTFGPSPQDAFKEAERSRLLQQEIQSEHDTAAKQLREKEAADMAKAQQAKAEEAVRVSAMKDRERQMLEQRKGPLKAYLMSNVIPVLTKGLIEVCNDRPEDPVDYLAEWLFKHNPEDCPDMYM